MPTSIKVAVRQLFKAPGFTITVVATVAICLAANLAIFAVVDAVVIRALPFPRSHELVTLLNAYPGAGLERSSSSLPNYYDRKAGMKSFTSMAIIQENAVTVGDVDSPTRINIARVSPGFFHTLGVPLALGREFIEDETKYGPDEVAILTDTYWRNHFGADPAVVGKTFLNDGLKTTVVGVLRPGFKYLSSRAEFFRPDAHDASEVTPDNRHNIAWDEIARLAPGVSIAQAQQEMNAFNAVQLKDDPNREMIAKAGYHTTIVGLHDDHVREVRPMLILLQCGVAFLFLIGAVNLANLFLIRASNKTKDFAVQRALGARAWHVASGILTETTIVALAGGLVGIVLGAFGTQLVRLLGTDDLPLGAAVVFDSRVALIGLAASVVAGIVLAVPTIWLGLSGGVASGLRSESRSGTSGPGVQRMRHSFIVVQVALAFILLSGAGLLTVSLKRIMAVPPGFVPEHVYAGNIPLPWNTYRDTPPREAFVRRLLPAIRALPGVTGAAISTQIPFDGATSDSAISVKDEPVSGPLHDAYVTVVTADYFPAMHIPLARGRLFTDSECEQKAHVVVVDQDFAARYWPNGDPVGKEIYMGPNRDPMKLFRIVGVIGNVKQTDLTEPSGHGSVYFPYPNEDLNTGFFALIVVSPLPEEALAPMVRKAMYGIDREIPLAQFRSMDSRISESIVTRRTPAILAGVFSLVALFLAAIGTYGVLSYVVTQRKREIGVRMALGAQPSQIHGQFLSLGLRLLATGAVLGIAGSWMAGRAMQSILFNVPALELHTLAAALAVLGVVAVVACLIPARRASQVDPIVALRDD